MIKPTRVPKSDPSIANKAGSRQGKQLVVRDSSGSHDHLDDLFEAHLADCQRRSAQKILLDFEKAGVDEDLEQLKACWAPGFGRRSPGTQLRQPIAKAICAHSGRETINYTHGARSQDEEEVSSLGLQAETARHRLNHLASLRSYVEVDQGKGRNSESHSVYQANTCIAPPSRRSSFSHASVFDSWDAWEQRWSQEFQQFEEFERAKSSQRAAEVAAARNCREAVWKQKVEQAKKQAEEAARKRREAQPRTDKPQSRTSTSSARSQQSGESRKAEYSEQNTNKEQQQRQQHEKPRNDKQRSGTASHPSKPVAPPGNDIFFACFTDFDVAWTNFEARVSAKEAVHYADIPWPTCLPTISGIEPKDTAEERKKKLRAALMRWHPDKWGSIFALVHDSDKTRVMDRVKEVTRRIIDEKKMDGI